MKVQMYRGIAGTKADIYFCSVIKMYVWSSLKPNIVLNVFDLSIKNEAVFVLKMMEYLFSS